MAIRLRRCGHCGEIIRSGTPTKFDTRLPDAVFHERCFWGTAASRGWSVLHEHGGPPLYGLVVQCPVCDADVDTRHDPTWYETDGHGRYRAYHMACSPSRIP